MVYRVVKITLAVSLLVLFSPAAGSAQFPGWLGGASAQPPPRDTLSGVGSVTLKRRPTVLRMYVQLSAKGKTLEEALAKMKDRREAVLVQLGSLKADKGSISFSGPTLSNPQAAQRRQFEAMVMQRMTSRGRKLPKGLKIPKSLTVSTTLSAQWPLEADGPERLLLAAQSLQEKVKAADLAGTKDAEKLSLQEEELAEEMAQMMRSSGEEPVPVGQPYFVYVARVSDEDRDKAMAEAFRKAKAQAARLAQAAGVQLGPLVGLAGQGGGSSSYLNERYGGYARGEYLQRMLAKEYERDPYGNQDEAVGYDPGALVFSFYVTAFFGLGK